MTENVQILSETYDTYASVEQANLYLAANFLATAWFDLSTDQQGQLLVTATRLFDRQCWLGEKTDTSTPQPLAWPRMNTGIAEVDAAPETVPNDIVIGSIEMAFAILDGNEAINSQVPGAQKLRSIAAGSVNLSWFRGAEGLAAEEGRFPLPVQELVGRYLCGSQGISGIIATGTDGESVLNDDLGYNEGV